MPSPSSPSQFVVEFHALLTAWFSGSVERETVWRALAETCPEGMRLIYPSGQRLDGAGFLRSIENRFATSPGFRAWIEDLEVLQSGPDFAVVAYVEAQTGATASDAENRRAAMALVGRTDGEWSWRFIQETALPSDA